MFVNKRKDQQSERNNCNTVTQIFLQIKEFVLCTLHAIRDINRLTPNDPYMGRTSPLTSKRCILYIYSTNIGTE